MQRQLYLKYISWLVLVALLTVIINGVHESAHAMQDHVKATASCAQCSAPHTCPCSPLEQHKDYDGCDTCLNCPCHAGLAVSQLVLNYNPIILNSRFSDPYQRLPEVFLSKFIPPQNHA